MRCGGNAKSAIATITIKKTKSRRNSATKRDSQTYTTIAGLLWRFQIRGFDIRLLEFKVRRRRLSPKLLEVLDHAAARV
jgi:hypothetical protein